MKRALVWLGGILIMGLTFLVGLTLLVAVVVAVLDLWFFSITNGSVVGVVLACFITVFLVGMGVTYALD